MSDPISAKLPNGIAVRQTTKSWETSGGAKEFGVEIKLDENLRQQFPKLHKLGTKRDATPDGLRDHLIRGREDDFMDGYLSPDEMRSELNPILFGVKTAEQYRNLIQMGERALLPLVVKAERISKFELGRAHTGLDVMRLKRDFTEVSRGEPSQFLTQAEIRAFDTAAGNMVRTMEIGDPALFLVIKTLGKLTPEGKEFRATVVDCLDKILQILEKAPFERTTGKDVAYGTPLKAPGEE